MQLTDKKTFKVVPNLQQPNTIKFQNKLGGWDVLQVTKYKQIEAKPNPSTYQNSTGEYTYSVDTNRKETYFSLYMNNDEYEWLQDLLASPLVFINGKYYKVLPSTFKFDNYENLWTFELQVSPQDRNKLTR